MSRKSAVVAIGGNSLIKDKQHQSVRDQYIAAGETCWHVASMIKDGWDVAIGHGNGPQVGFILRRSELAAHELHEVPLDVCGADSQGAIGYALAQNLENDFHRLDIDRHAVTVVTQVEVVADDPAFRSPSKPIGSFMDEAEAMRRRDQDGWSVKEDAGRGWRRVVASPEPIRIVEVDAIRSLIENRFVVISVGGGGIPVVADENGELTGIAAVIDKDHACALLANEIEAELLLITTAVEKVALDFGQPTQRWIDRMTLARGEGVPRRGHALPAGQHGAEDRGRRRLPRARRRHRDHHRPGERRARARRRDGDADRRRLTAATEFSLFPGRSGSLATGRSLSPPARTRYARTMTDLSRRLAVARGDEPADPVVRGGRVLLRLHARVARRRRRDRRRRHRRGRRVRRQRGDRRHRPLRRPRLHRRPHAPRVGEAARGRVRAARAAARDDRRRRRPARDRERARRRRRPLAARRVARTCSSTSTSWRRRACRPRPSSRRDGRSPPATSRR